MRMSELSAASGVPVPTIKYYLRIGLLPAGLPLGPNQHRYGEQHLRRIDIIRALIGVARLSVAEVCDVVGADAERLPRTADALGMDRSGFAELADDERNAACAEIERAARERGWHVFEGSVARDRAALAYTLLTRLGSADPAASLKRCADAAEALARAEAAARAEAVDSRAAPGPVDVLVDELLLEVLLGALWRLARAKRHARASREPHECPV